MESTIIIKMGNDSFERYIKEKMTSENVMVWDTEEFYPITQTTAFGRMKCWVTAVKRFRKRLRSLPEIPTRIISFELNYYWVTLLLCAKHRKTELHFWQWNAIGQELKKYNGIAPIWTFDDNDAERNGWRKNHQFYFWPENTKAYKCGKSSGAFFVGRDKGRKDTLLKIKDVLQNNGIETTIILFDDSISRQSVNGIQYTNQLMDYEDIIEQITQHEIIIDLAKDKQNGLTIRALEAAFYEKKMITNNPAIAKEPLYDPNNVFIIGEDNWEDFPVFIAAPYVKLPREKLDAYTYENWLANFRR